MDPSPTAASSGSSASDALAEVRRIVLAGLSGYAVDVYLFGSRARGTARRGSDVDVAILPTAPLPPGLLARVRESLEESHVPYVVEVVDLSEASDALRRRVLEEGIRWTV